MLLSDKRGVEIKDKATPKPLSPEGPKPSTSKSKLKTVRCYADAPDEAAGDAANASTRPGQVCSQSCFGGTQTAPKQKLLDPSPTRILKIWGKPYSSSPN